MRTPKKTHENRGDSLTQVMLRATTASILLLIGISPSRSAAQEMRAEKVYEWTFGSRDDINADEWPDNWRRRRDREHPGYIEMRIAPRDVEVATTVAAAKKTLIQLMRLRESGRWDPSYIPEATPPELAEFLDLTVLNNCVEIRMDGASAEMISPTFPMDPRFRYRLEAEISSSNLFGHSAWAELQMLDANGDLLDTLQTPAMNGNVNWQKTVARVETAPAGQLHSARIHLRVQSKHWQQIAGVVRFDSLRVYRMPRFSLSSSAPRNVVEPGQPVEIECAAMGIKNEVESVRFHLHDIHGNFIEEASVPLRHRPAPQREQVFVGHSDSRPHYMADSATAEVFDATALWTIQLDTPGLYRVSVDLGHSGIQSEFRSMLIAAIAPAEKNAAGPFGWSIPEFTVDASPESLPELAAEFGAGWVKFPVWFEAQDLEQGDRLITLAERLQAHGIQCIGVLDRVSQQSSDATPFSGDHSAFVQFQDPAVWEPQFEPVLTRMGMKLSWFQIGADDDLSLMDGLQATEMLREIRIRMQNYCQELKLAITWDWLNTPPDQQGDLPWQAIQYRVSPQHTAAEIEAYASGSQNFRETRWIELNPLPKSQYSLFDRVRDLTKRMIAVRKSGIAAAFLNKPFDLEQGLFTETGEAGEMLIPWRQLTSHLGSRKYAGSIYLPQGTTNHFFDSSGDDGIMIAWSDAGPVTEQMYLGAEVSAQDIWGRPVEVQTTVGPRGTPEQRLVIGDWPVIIRGISMEVIRWHQKFHVQTQSLTSILGEQQSLPLTVENSFPQTISGRLTLHSPTLLSQTQASLPLQIAKGRTLEQALPIDLRPDASTGSHVLRFDFDVDAERPYQFSVYREIALGLGDIQLIWSPVRLSESQVELRVELVNSTDEKLSFDCKIFPPGKPYERFQILDAARGATSKSFRLASNETAEPSMHWIRCEQIGSGRVLNYRIEF